MTAIRGSDVPFGTEQGSTISGRRRTRHEAIRYDSSLTHRERQTTTTMTQHTTPESTSTSTQRASAMPSFEPPTVDVIAASEFDAAEYGIERRPDDVAAAGLDAAAAEAAERHVDATTDASAATDESVVLVSGTMYHSGLNLNAWGLTQSGAQVIADDLRHRELTASHPRIRGDRYDRAMADSQGMPIGVVWETDVASAESAMLSGGGYTAEYAAEVLDPVYKARFARGLRTGDDYGVSIGILGDPESASCSVCGEQMQSESCDHERFQEITRETADGTQTEIAGPLFDDGDADHLASVYLPAYEDATASIQTDTETQTETQTDTDTTDTDTGTGTGDGGGDGGETTASAVATAGAQASSSGAVPTVASVLAAPYGGGRESTPESASASASERAADGEDPASMDGVVVRRGSTRVSTEGTRVDAESWR